MTLQPARPSGAQLLRASIDRSRLTIRAYAAKLFRSERTVSRWLDGETQIPRAILKYLLDEADANNLQFAEQLAASRATPNTR